MTRLATVLEEPSPALATPIASAKVDSFELQEWYAVTVLEIAALIA